MSEPGMVVKGKPMCQTCRFFDQVVGSDYGFCRMKPPTVRVQKYNITQIGAGETNFPIVIKTEWCGEHAERDHD